MRAEPPDVVKTVWELLKRKVIPFRLTALPEARGMARMPWHTTNMEGTHEEWSVATRRTQFVHSYLCPLLAAGCIHPSNLRHPHNTNPHI